MKQENRVVTKSNSLNEARYRLTVQEQRIILSVISLIQPNDEDFKVYRIKVSDFLAFLEIQNQQVYPEIKRITKSLMEKILIIKKEESELHISWFSSAEYFDKKGYVELRFDPKLKPYLLKLKECFTSYHLENVIHLRSIYSIRIYELLKQYEFVAKRTFDVFELREILGIRPDEYKLYGDFKRHVILPAQKELKQKTDIKFNLKEIKTGRKVTSMEFIVEKNNGLKSHSKQPLPKPKFDKDEDNDFQTLVELLPPEHQSKKTILEMIATAYKNYGFEYVSSNIRYANQNSKNNYRAYLNKAIKENWGTAIIEEEVARKEAKAQEKDQTSMIEQQKKEDEDLKRRNEKLGKQALAYIESLSPEEKEGLRQEAINRYQARGKGKNPPKEAILETLIRNIVMEKLGKGEIPLSAKKLSFKGT
ncbi:MAG: replication initiation protein [Actinobacteria bacterium]|nr:replication initiation protein [Actinomycetota bacterium]